MSKFKKVLKKKVVESALTKHPIRELDQNLREDYIKGLVFIAVEDETFSEEEKSYIIFLMKNLEMDESKLAEFESFAQEPDEDELVAFMDRIKAFNENTKINFLIEAVVLAFKDGNFDDSEKEMFNDYLEMFELEDKKDIILYMAQALADKNVDLALALYTADKEFFEKFDYLFDIVDIDIEKELKNLYSWEWVKFRLEQGQVEDNNLVASKPVTVRQFCVFLNSGLISKNLKQFVNTTQFEYNDNAVIKNINNTNLSFDVLFDYEEDKKDDDIIGVEDVDSFVEFVNNKTQNSVKWLRIISDGQFVQLDDSAKGLLTDNKEKFIAHSVIGNSIKFFNLSEVDYRFTGKCNTKSDTSYTFRLMKIEKSDEE